MSYSKEEQIKIIQDGFDILHKKKKYKQAKVVAKLSEIRCKTSTAVMSRILNSKNDQLGDALVDKVFIGYEKLMEFEMGQQLNKRGIWKPIKNATPKEILISEKDPFKIGKQFHSHGRLAPTEKIDFFSSAKKEMIEFGLTLNTFSIYLNNINQNGFRKSLIEILKKDVKVRCYLLDPEWNGTKIYFDDRESIIKEELLGIEKIKASLRRLKIFYSEILDEEYSKNFEVYTYRHFPSNYFLAIDREVPSKAKMMISNYLFGQRRIMCPVIEFSRVGEPTLFLRYNESLQKIMKDAKRVNLEKF